MASDQGESPSLDFGKLVLFLQKLRCLSVQPMAEYPKKCVGVCGDSWSTSLHATSRSHLLTCSLKAIDHYVGLHHVYYELRLNTTFSMCNTTQQSIAGQDTGKCRAQAARSE
ncbi:hypothetical protein Mapa_001546 [Marchantia paleacea]|nr:hypothetical protein Mapa_001546 [Marchantia paleacea]